MFAGQCSVPYRLGKVYFDNLYTGSQRLSLDNSGYNLLDRCAIDTSIDGPFALNTWSHDLASILKIISILFLDVKGNLSIHEFRHPCNHQLRKSREQHSGTFP